MDTLADSISLKKMCSEYISCALVWWLFRGEIFASLRFIEHHSQFRKTVDNQIRFVFFFIVQKAGDTFLKSNPLINFEKSFQHSIMHSFKLTRRELAHEADRQALLNSQQNLCSTFFSIRFNQLDKAFSNWVRSNEYGKLFWQRS